MAQGPDLGWWHGHVVVVNGRGGAHERVRIAAGKAAGRMETRGEAKEEGGGRGRGSLLIPTIGPARDSYR